MLLRLLKRRCLSLLQSLSFCLVRICSQSGFLSSLYFYVFSNEFRREHKAVLKGIVEYERSKKDVDGNLYLLRRNVHRIEKGLVMRPRKSFFAQNYIEETVDAYCSLRQGGKKNSGLDWACSVLNKYFEVVESNDLVIRLKKRFYACEAEGQLKENNDLVPIKQKDLKDINVSYQSFYELCKRRKSVRWFLDKEVDSIQIERAIEVATFAPSACNRQPFKFYATKNKETAQKIASMAGGTAGFSENIPCVIAVVGELHAYQFEKDRHLIYIDSSLASMQLILSFETLGLSTCCLNWPDVDFRERSIQKALGLKESERTIMLIAVGYPDPEGGIPYSHKKSAISLLTNVNINA